MRFLKSTNLSPADIRRAPSLAFLGGRDEVISTMRYSRHPAILQFLGVWDQTPERDRQQIPFEAIALKARIDIAELIGAYLLTFRTLQQQKSALLAMSAHPEVVEKTIEFAHLENGMWDRRMVHDAVGFLPSPRGPGVVINQNFGQLTEEQETEAKFDTATAPDIEDIFPLINEREEKWQNSRQKLLEGTN